MSYNFACALRVLFPKQNKKKPFYLKTNHCTWSLKCYNENIFSPTIRVERLFANFLTVFFVILILSKNSTWEDYGTSGNWHGDVVPFSSIFSIIHQLAPCSILWFF